MILTILSTLLPLLTLVRGDNQPSYAAPGGRQGGAGDPIDALGETIPGEPGEDYPIYSSVPDTSFQCDGQVQGGYYADTEGECQVFHICGGGEGSLVKYSFLCPNGSLFNQQYFVCDWWFNVDCSLAEDLYSLNDEIAAEREANSAGGGYGAPGDSPVDKARRAGGVQAQYGGK